MSSSPPPLRIGTRGSPLALAQAEDVAKRLAAAHLDLFTEITVISTMGDRILDRALSEVGGKGLFTKEIDEALLDGRIDIAVHSMKDVPTWLPDGIRLPVILEREDTRDVFISNKAETLWELPEGATVGSAALRRQAQILRRRPDLKVVTFRGNVQTRLKKLAAGDVDATLLALAGLNRLGMSDVATSVLSEDEFLPAVAQGAVGIACRADDAATNGLIAPLSHTETQTCIAAERAFLATLDGSCRTPIAARATLDGDRLSFRGLIAGLDGREVFEDARAGAAADADGIGRAAGEAVMAEAGEDFFTALKAAL